MSVEEAAITTATIRVHTAKEGGRSWWGRESPRGRLPTLQLGSLPGSTAPAPHTGT